MPNIANGLEYGQIETVIQYLHNKLTKVVQFKHRHHCNNNIADD